MADKLGYVKTFFTDGCCNGRLGCICGGRDGLDFSIKSNRKRASRSYLKVKVLDDGIEFADVGFRQKYPKEDVLLILKAVISISEDYKKWREENP